MFGDLVLLAIHAWFCDKRLNRGDKVIAASHGVGILVWFVFFWVDLWLGRTLW